MRLYRLAISVLCMSVFLGAASGPDSRQPTDPKSVAAPANPAAQPISIADLFYSRQIVPGSWSPDGHEIVFSTNITGRLNLWKVNSAGGWPIQLSQSDDRQDRASFSPDGKWIVYQQDVGGGEIYDIYKIPSDGGPAINLTKTPEISEVNPDLLAQGRSPWAGAKTEDLFRFRRRRSRLEYRIRSQSHQRKNQGPHLASARLESRRPLHLCRPFPRRLHRLRISIASTSRRALSKTLRHIRARSSTPPPPFHPMAARS